MGINIPYKVHPKLPHIQAYINLPKIMFHYEIENTEITHQHGCQGGRQMRNL